MIWHAYFKGQHAFVYAGNVMTGSFITADAVGTNNDLGRSASSQVLVSGPRSSMDPDSFVHWNAPSVDSDTVLKISRMESFTRELPLSCPAGVVLAVPPASFRLHTTTSRATVLGVEHWFMCKIACPKCSWLGCDGPYGRWSFYISMF